MLIPHVIYGVIVVMGLLSLAYGVAVLLMARHYVNSSPKKEMFMCNIHGPMSIESTITLFDGDMEYEVNGISKKGPIRQCPLCFEEKIKHAKQTYGQSHQ